MNRGKAPHSIGALSATNKNNIVGVHYQVGKKIGEGSFGVIYEGLNLLTKTKIAIKFESKKSDAPQLKDEYKTYKLLSNCEGIPKVYYFGPEPHHFVLCLDLLGSSLEDCFDLCKRKFTTKTVALIAIQMIKRIQIIHLHHLIYRDIKPDNFLISNDNKLIYMVDFGMAKYYRDPNTKQHIPYKEKKSLSGTARYMSINTHLGREQSRRDDLESIGHVLLYFLRGSLPWQGLKAANNKAKYEKIGQCKAQTDIKELCKNIPKQFETYLTYSRNLLFDQEPDYEYLINLFKQVLIKLGHEEDYIYDWNITEKLNKRPELKSIQTDNLTNKATLNQSLQNATNGKGSNHPLVSAQFANSSPYTQTHNQVHHHLSQPNIQDETDLPPTQTLWEKIHAFFCCL